MRKLILGLFIILFCFSVGVADEQEAYKKALIEVFRSNGFLVEGFEGFNVTTLEAMIRILVRQNLEEKGFKLVDPKKDSLDWLKIKQKSWFKEEERAWRLGQERRKREALLKKQEEENTRLQYLIWELDAVKSDIRLELDFMQNYYLFKPYLWYDFWLCPSPTRYFKIPLELTPSTSLHSFYLWQHLLLQKR